MYNAFYFCSCPSVIYKWYHKSNTKKVHEPFFLPWHFLQPWIMYAYSVYKIKLLYTRKFVLPPPFILALRNTNFLLSTTYCASFWHEGYPFSMARVLINPHWKQTWVLTTTLNHENHQNHHFCNFLRLLSRKFQP